MKIVIKLEINDAEMAMRITNLLIDWERTLRTDNGPSGHMPVTPKVRLADAIREARRSLQDGGYQLQERKRI